MLHGKLHARCKSLEGAYPCVLPACHQHVDVICPFIGVDGLEIAEGLCHQEICDDAVASEQLAAKGNNLGMGRAFSNQGAWQISGIGSIRQMRARNRKKHEVTHQQP